MNKDIIKKEKKVTQRKDKIIDILTKTLKLAKDTLPDSRKWKYCWDEMTSEEQEEVKRVATEIDKALGLYKEGEG